MSNCDICNDSKHIYKQEMGWTTCECLNNTRLNNFLRETNIPKIYENINWEWYQEKFPHHSKLKILLKKLIDSITDKKPIPWIALTGSQDTGKLGFVSLLIKELYSNGMSCSIETLYDLVHVQFSDYDELKSRIDKDFMCLRLGIGSKHSSNKTILSYIFDTRRRKGKYNIFTMRDDLFWFDDFYGCEQLTEKFKNLVKFVNMDKK